MMCNAVPKAQSPIFNSSDMSAQAENGGPSPSPSLRDLEVGFTVFCGSKLGNSGLEVHK